VIAAGARPRGTARDPRIWIDQHHERADVIAYCMSDPARFLEQLRAIADPHHGGADSGEHLQNAREARDPLLRLMPRTARGGLGQGALYRRGEPREIGLEDVVDRAVPQRIDGSLFTDGTGDKDKRYVGGLDRGDGERRHAVESRQGEIGQDDVRPQIAQPRAEFRLALDTPPFAIQASRLERPDGELSFRGNVFQDEEA
jgi:hypothetical protein